MDARSEIIPMIGMGSVVMNGAKIGNHCLIGAGSLVTQNTVIPDRSLVMGSPARVKRTLTEDEIKYLEGSREEYVEVGKLLREDGIL